MLLTRLPLPLRGVRLACVRPAASVRSEPGSNSQVVMRICARLVTVRSAHLHETNQLSCSTSPKHTCPPRLAAQKTVILKIRDRQLSHRPPPQGRSVRQHPQRCRPQGQSRPRFSFFRFKCQTAHSRPTAPKAARTTLATGKPCQPLKPQIPEKAPPAPTPIQRRRR